MAAGDQIWYKGAATLKFTPTSGTAIETSKTLKDNDVKIVYTTEIYEQYSDQDSSPEVQILSAQVLKITCSTPVEYDSLVGLTSEWVKGTTGYALKDSLGDRLVSGVLEVIPKGTASGDAGTYKLGKVRAKVDMEENLKVDGKIFTTIEYTASKDADGNFMTTGDYVKKTVV